MDAKSRQVLESYFMKDTSI